MVQPQVTERSGELRQQHEETTAAVGEADHHQTEGRTACSRAEFSSFTAVKIAVFVLLAVRLASPDLQCFTTGANVTDILAQLSQKALCSVAILL